MGLGASAPKLALTQLPDSAGADETKVWRHLLDRSYLVWPPSDSRYIDRSIALEARVVEEAGGDGGATRARVRRVGLLYCPLT